MKFKWKKPSEAGMLTDDQKREMLDQRLDQVCKVIDRYEAAHISSQKHVQIDQAICTLHEQNTILLKAADEVVDTTDQEELQRMIMRLIRVITIYEEHKVKSHNRESSSIPQTPSTSFPPPPPLPPRRATTKIIDRNETETRVAEWVVDVAEKGTGKNGEGSPESLHPGVMEDSRLVSSPEIQTAITHTANHEVDKLTKQSLDATLVVSDFRN
ncbi:hypothetical protein BC833DRAFT_88944 [Globomyces pollinis-pini]|nr:hypothetical protein BC833DRAFT_88944 [Globomyces pollinis-pini]